MASLRVHPDRLEIHLTPAEKTLALRREDLVISRDTIRSVTITDDPWIWVRGIRAPGALVPLVLAVGVWKFHGGKDFLAIKRKRQAVVIDLTGDDFARVILSTNHAPDLIASLKLEPTEAADVADETVTDAAASDATEPADAAAEPSTPAKPAKRVRTPKAPKAPKPAKPATAVAPTEAAKPAKVVTRTESATSAKPAKVVTPTESAESAKPAKVVTPTESAESAKPTEAVTPTESAKSAKPTEAVTPAKSTAPAPADAVAAVAPEASA
jgi:outer membrane biosynthesis protein TonB